MPATLSGLAARGRVLFVPEPDGYVIWSGVSVSGLFPPVVVGPVIMVIGLGLATVAVNMAMGAYR